MRKSRPPLKAPRNRNYQVTLTGLATECTPSGSTLRTYQMMYRYAALTVNNPWRQNKPKPLDFTPRSLSHTRFTLERCTVAYNTPGNYRPGVVVYNQPLSSPQFLTKPNATSVGTWEKLRTEAILDICEKVKDQNWNAGVMLAESAGVAKMVADGAELVTSLRRLIRKGDFGAAYAKWKRERLHDKRVLTYPAWRRKYWQQVKHIKHVRAAKKVPQGWLYYHFGLKPTINDLDAAVIEMMQPDKLSAFELGGIVKGYAKHTVKTSLIGNTTGSNGLVTRETLSSVRISCRVRPKPGFAHKLSKMGVTNPPEAIYNWLPFSWVVDYFSSLGDFISVLDVGLGWSFDTKWMEAKRTLSVARMTPVNSDTGYFVTYISAPSRPSVATWKDINRQVIVGLYGPLGTILPRWKRKGPSATKIANLLSVLALQFGRGTPRI